MSLFNSKIYSFPKENVEELAKRKDVKRTLTRQRFNTGYFFLVCFCLCSQIAWADVDPSNPYIDKVEIIHTDRQYADESIEQSTIVKVKLFSEDGFLKDRIAHIEMRDKKGVVYYFDHNDFYSAKSGDFYLKQFPMFIGNKMHFIIHDFNGIEYDFFAKPYTNEIRTSFFYDGNWIGTTNQGFDISFSVRNNHIIELIIKVRVIGTKCSKNSTTYSATVLSINENTFSFYSLLTGLSEETYIGTFVDNLKCTGTWELTDYECQGYAHGTWTAINTTPATTTTTSTTTSTTTTSTSSTTTTTLPIIPTEPNLFVTTMGPNVNLSWGAVNSATGYILNYATYPYTGPETIGSADMGNQTSVSFELWKGAAFYVALQAYNGFGSSEYSNIEYFSINSSIWVEPSMIAITVGETGSCTTNGGTRPYRASSSNASVAAVSVDGSMLYITGVSDGSATINVNDNSGDLTTVSVTVTRSTYTNSLGQTFVLLPAGKFIMGSPENEPGSSNRETPHEVTLTQSFYMQQTEVTQAQWEAVMGSNPSYFSGCPTCPVEYVTWKDVQDFIIEINKSGEGIYSLPTEAQWEYAARAGSTTAFANGGIKEYPNMSDCNYDEILDSMGWYCYNADKPHPGGQKSPNAWGLYDMHGNVYEWCQDRYGIYPSSAVTNPAGPSSGSSRVMRGGNWQSRASFCRSAYRAFDNPFNLYYFLGFRLMRQP